MTGNRTWPFWIENVVDQEAWEEAGQEFVFLFQSVTNFDKNSESRCPGLGKGRLHDAKVSLIDIWQELILRRRRFSKVHKLRAMISPSNSSV